MYKGGLFKRNARQISKVIVHGIRQKQHFEVFFNGEEFAYSNVYAQLCGHSKFRVCCWDLNFNTRNSLEIRNKKLTWWIIPFLSYFPTFHSPANGWLPFCFEFVDISVYKLERKFYLNWAWVLSSELAVNTNRNISEDSIKVWEILEISWFWLAQWYARNR